MKKNMSKAEEKAIKSRIETIVDKYGYDSFRKVASKYIQDTRLRIRLESTIKRKEEELRKLKMRK